MRRPTRGRRAGRVAWVGVGVVGAIAAWGVPVDADRVASLVAPDQPARVRADAAWIALRPLPTVVASRVRMSVAGRARAELSSMAIRIGIGGEDGRTPTWRAARVRGGRVVVREAGGGVALQCAELRGRVVLAEPRAARLDMTGVCRAPGIRLPGVRYRGEVAWRGRGVPRSTGQVTSARTRIGVLRGGAIAVTLRTAGDGARLDDLQLAIGGGAVRGRGRWFRAGDVQRVALGFEGAGDAAEAAFVEVSHRITGAWMVRGRGRAIAAGGAPLGRVVSGRGRVVLTQGSVEPLDVGTAVLDGLEIWRGRRRRRLGRRFPDVFGGEQLHFDRAAVRVAVRRGRWDFAPLRVRSRSYRADGHGRLSRDGSVHGELRLVPGEALADALVGRGALRAVVAGENAEVVFPIEVRGRIGALRVRPAPAFARAVLERALGGSALGRALERVLGR